MRIIKTKDYDNMSRKAANIISAQVILQPSSVLGLATGSTPLGIYKQLIDRYNQGDLDFSHICAINLDEYRGLPKTSDQSYHYFMNENLFRHINMNDFNTHIPAGMEPDPEMACDAHDCAIRDSGGIDLQLLGLGHNGHIGFNEPGESFEKKTHCVTLAQSTITANARFFENPEDVPTQAYTMGIQSIMQARQILMVVSGKEKADIVYKSFFGPITPQVPASVLQLHQNFILVTDEDAFSACPAD